VRSFRRCVCVSQGKKRIAAERGVAAGEPRDPQSGGGFPRRRGQVKLRIFRPPVGRAHSTNVMAAGGSTTPRSLAQLTRAAYSSLDGVAGVSVYRRRARPQRKGAAGLRDRVEQNYGGRIRAAARRDGEDVSDHISDAVGNPTRTGYLSAERYLYSRAASGTGGAEADPEEHLAQRMLGAYGAEHGP